MSIVKVGTPGGGTQSTHPSKNASRHFPGFSWKHEIELSIICIFVAAQQNLDDPSHYLYVDAKKHKGQDRTLRGPISQSLRGRAVVPQH